jgi:hypothetical protein
MATWSSRRKSSIALVLGVIILGAAIAVYFTIFYKAPTCFDNIMNGDEQGIDCGGKCERLCQSAFLPAQIAWGGGKFEMIAPSLYNVAALIINPNTNAAAVNVPYKFSLYDSRGLLLIERKGTLTIPAHRNTLAFETAVDVGKRTPTKVTFEFMSPPVWFKSIDTLGGLAIVDKKYSENSGDSSLLVTLENRSLVPINNITVGAILFDIDGNAIGFSRTQIDSLAPNGGRDVAPFTWPINRQGRVVSIEALPVVPPIRK